MEPIDARPTIWTLFEVELFRMGSIHLACAGQIRQKFDNIPVVEILANHSFCEFLVEQACMTLGFFCI